MQKIAGTLPHSRGGKVGSMPQLQLKKKSIKRNLKEEEEEYYLISALSSTITKSEDVWLMDSGASKHMTGFK
jgi:hypothetical protein